MAAKRQKSAPQLAVPEEGSQLAVPPAFLSLNEEQKQLFTSLKDIHDKNPQDFLTTRDSDPDVKVLEDLGMAETGSLPDNKIAVRLKTQWPVPSLVNGATKLPNGQAEAEETPAMLKKFPLTAGLNIPPAPIGGKREEEYPFSLMQVGDSFLVPVSDKWPKPWDAFASTVSSANRRFSVKSATEFRTNRKGDKIPKLIPTRKFILRRVQKGFRYDNGHVEAADGVRVYRIE